MSWCDKLASVPIAGLKFEHHFLSSSQLLDALSRVLDDNMEGDKPQFSLDEQGPFNVVFTTKDGFRYTADQSKLTIGFNHRVKIKPVTGGPPVMEMVSKPMKFTDLLDDCIERLIEASGYFRAIRLKPLNRIGIVSATSADQDALPPGVLSLINHMGRPWQNRITDFNFRILANLRNDDRVSERCVHNFIKTEDPEDLTAVTFDWQRIYLKPQPADEKSLRRQLADCKDQALQYFEELAIGSRFDEFSTQV